MTDEELEEVIISLKAAGLAMPDFKILPDGSYLIYTNGQEIGDIRVYNSEPRSDVQ